MTSRRITVSLPEDVATYLESRDNASAEVAAAVRQQMRRGQAIKAALRAVGYQIDDERIERLRGTMPRLSEDVRAEALRRRAELKARHRPTPAA